MVNTVDMMIIVIGILLILVKLPAFLRTKDTQIWIKKKLASPKKKKNVQYLGLIMLVLFSFFSFYLLQTTSLVRALATFIVFSLFFYGLFALAYPKYIQNIAEFWAKDKSLRTVSLLVAILGLVMILLVVYLPYA